MNLIRQIKIDKLWRIITIFDKLNGEYATHYSPTEHLAVDEITLLFKDRVVFKQNIANKHKRLGIKVYQQCDSKGYSFINMSVRQVT
jgi:hypothetical protein